MKHFLNWLYFDDGQAVSEVFNGARTIEYLSTLSCGLVTIRSGAGCDILYRDPCDYDTVLDFTTTTAEDNPAPWAVAGTPSADAYGFWITDWTGLDGAHMRRSATSAFPRGSVFGPLGQAHRVWKMNVLLHGANDAALQALYRWLEETLVRCCRPGVTAWVRTACPDGYDEDYGLAHVVDLELLEGVEWLAPPRRELSCFVREVSFTLGVADPCLYGPPANCLTDEVFPTNSVVISTTGNDEVAETGSTTLTGVSGALYLDWFGALTDWTPASEQTLMSMTTGVNPNFGFRLGVTTAGLMRLRLSTNGSSFGVDITSGFAVSDLVANGEEVGLRVYRDAVTGSYNFWYSLDGGTSWETGDNIYLPAASGSLFATTTNIEIGDANGSNRMVGYVNRAEMRAYDSSGSLVERVEFQPENFDGASTYADEVSALTWTLGTTGITVTDEGAVDLCGHGLEGIFGCPSDPDAFADWRLCCPVVTEPIGVTAGVVILRNNNTESFSPPLRVIGVQDSGNGCIVTANAFLGEVRVAGIPPQSELMVDCARRRVLWRPVGYTRPWETGYSYLDQSSAALPQYPEFACFDGYLMVEPTALTAALTDLQVTVDLVNRFGCC